MDIKNIYINSFGKLNGININLSKGINIIYGENEKGKSTIISFIKAMLYGLNSKKQSLTDNLRKKYMPWNGKKSAGVMIVDLNGDELLISRSFAESKRYDEVEIKNNVTGENIGFLDFETDEELFDKTSYFPQFNFSFANSEDINKRAMNFNETSEEDLSVSDALKKLKGSYKNLTKKGGEIEDLLIKKENLKEELLAVQKLLEDNFENINNLKTLLKEKESLDKKIQYSDGELLEDIKDLDESLKVEEELFSDLSRLNGDFDEREIYFKESRKKFLEGSVEENKKLIKAINLEKKLKPLIYISVGILFLTLLLVLMFDKSFLISTGIVFLCLNIILFIDYNNKDKVKGANKLKANFGEYKVLEAWLSDFYKKLEINDYIEFITKLKEYREYKSSIDLLKGVIKEKHLELDKIEIEKKSEKLITIEREISTLNNTIQGAFNRSRDTLLLEEEILSIEEEIKKDRIYSRALEISIEEVESAYKKLQSDFWPRLNVAASKIIEEITKGKYKELKVSSNLDINIVEEEYKFLKEVDYFSIGTNHQSYFALKIALLELLDKDNMPILLDEAFTQYDDIRLQQVLEYIIKISEKRQIIIFSCQKREIEILRKIKSLKELNKQSLKVNIIEL